MNNPNIKAYLDREKIDLFMNEKLSPSIGLLRELVDYGVELLDKCNQCGGSTSDLVTVGHFFRHAITMLDGTEILLSRGAVIASGATARSMLEAYIYIAWLLEKDTERRGRQFYVWHLRQKRDWARRTIPGTPENARFQKELASLSLMNDPASKSALESQAQKEDAEITTILTNRKNKVINAEFDKLKVRAFDVSWYRPNGPQSIGQMAKGLGLEKEYKIFYSEFSDITHVGAFDKSVKVDAKGASFEPIRCPENIHTLISLISSLAFRIFRLIITKYLPTELPSFTSSYITQWRKRYRTIPEVVVNVSEN